MPPVKLSTMRSWSAWEDEGTRFAHVARQLKLGRLAIALGAGASRSFDLPDWDDLVDRCLEHESLPFEITSNEDAADWLFTKICGRDRMEFASRVRKALYRNARLELAELSDKSLLSALAALTMTSIRGSVVNVIAYNFDDLLERYLSYHGYVTTSVHTVPEWPIVEDVRIYHPHGLLPSDESQEIPRPIVFTASDYRNVLKDDYEAWRRELIRLYESHFFLFVGLSGDDDNFMGSLSDAASSHRSKKDGDLFWGVRFSDDHNDPRREEFEEYGIYQHTVDEWVELSSLLLNICHTSAQSFR